MDNPNSSNFIRIGLRMTDLDLFFQGFMLEDLDRMQMLARVSGWGLRVGRYIDGALETVPWTDESRELITNSGNIGFRFFGPSHTMAHLMHWAGAFGSVSDARRNGWAKPVPPGFSMYEVGKRRIEVTVLNDIS